MWLKSIACDKSEKMPAHHDISGPLVPDQGPIMTFLANPCRVKGPIVTSLCIIPAIYAESLSIHDISFQSVLDQGPVGTSLTNPCMVKVQS